MDIYNKVGNTGDKKHAKREGKSRLKHKYYWVYEEEDILFNGMKSVYNIMNIQDKVKMKHFYNIRCDPDLGEGFCDMQIISCPCTGCVEKSPIPGYITGIKTYNHVMLSNPKHVNTLPY